MGDLSQKSQQIDLADEVINLLNRFHRLKYDTSADLVETSVETLETNVVSSFRDHLRP